VAKRPYSTRFRGGPHPRRYLLSGIPPTLWATARAQARREGVAMRTLILSLLEAWVVPPVPSRGRTVTAAMRHQAYQEMRALLGTEQGPVVDVPRRREPSAE